MCLIALCGCIGLSIKKIRKKRKKDGNSEVDEARDSNDNHSIDSEYFIQMVTLRDLIDILNETKPPERKFDPKTKFPILPPDVPESCLVIRSKEEIYKLENIIYKYMVPEVEEIVPNVFIGNVKAAEDLPYLKCKGITHVLNVAEGNGFEDVSLHKSDFHRNGIQYHGMKIVDRADPYDQHQIIDLTKGANTVQDILEKEGRVVVVCRNGLSRSAVIILAFLILKRSLDAATALRLLKSKRDVMPSKENLVHIIKISNLVIAGAPTEKKATPIDLLEHFSLPPAPPSRDAPGYKRHQRSKSQEIPSTKPNHNQNSQEEKRISRSLTGTLTRQIVQESLV